MLRQFSAVEMSNCKHCQLSSQGGKFGVYTVYIKVKVKVKFFLEEALKVQRGNRGKAVLFL